MRGNKLIISLVCLGVISSATGASQTAQVGNDWLSIVVKPLMKEVVVPALEKGVDNWKA